MAGFQKRFCDFLSECKHDALLELGGNEAYSRWKRQCAELNGSLVELMPPQCLEVFKQYQEAVSAISGIESDYCYLCGMRDNLGIGQQFDKSNGAWDELVSHMIPDAAIGND